METKDTKKEETPVPEHPAGFGGRGIPAPPANQEDE